MTSLMSSPRTTVSAGDEVGLGAERCVGAGGAFWPVVACPAALAGDADPVPGDPDEPEDPPDEPAAGLVVVCVAVVWVVVVWLWVDVVRVPVPWVWCVPLFGVPLCFCLPGGAPGVGPLLLFGPVVVRPVVVGFVVEPACVTVTVA
jgi:hypothetical protein